MLDSNRSARLRTVRETLGLSQREFAKELGVAPSALAQWETERREPPGPILRLLGLYEEQLKIAPPEPVPSATRQRRSSAPPPFKRTWAPRTASTIYATALWAVLRNGVSRPGASSLEASVRSAAVTHYVRTLGELKGLGMKLGQMLANVDALDPTLADQDRKPLSAAVLQATPMPARDVLEVFLEDFGRTPREMFASWSLLPLFAASIGQVHDATLPSGERVAVKVQYPFIVETLRTDFRNIELLDRLLCVIFPGQRPGMFFEELRARLTEECDYVVEAESTRRYRRFFADRDDIRIPKVFDAFSSARVLTTEFISGKTLDTFACTANQAARDRAGRAIWDFFYKPSGTSDGFFHADPHPGNVVVHDDGSVTFLDHGRVARMAPEFVGPWHDLCRAVIEKDRTRALELFARLDFASFDDAFDNDDIYRCLVANMLPWLWDGPFAFTKEFAHSAWKAFEAARLRAKLNVPRDAVLWTQLIFGVAGLLVPLRCVVDCRSSMLASMYGGVSLRPAPYTREELTRLGIAC